ncbi:FAD-dependent oxidoreductase [Stratiformator vulcanicus]|uniref:Thioredoxin reductase n=1 Tax=Stratiformator vulcanicus TaxID=2527980 RepID=A0A517QY42_9PLAN|nr:cyclic nucleotide-binding domain-containing thioredoxin-disulfide reductase [Stratiformator vulcanicus]QDT36545.1 Thioredoxin reductase [Stratiformator vulcanicus]
MNQNPFPSLSDDEMSCLQQYGTCRQFDDGESLFEAGDRDYSFYAIKSGEVVVLDRTGDDEKEVAVHQEGEFTGDVSLLTGQPAVVSAVARGGCETFEVKADRVRFLLSELPGLSEKLLEAFQIRRQILEGSDFQGLRVVGPLNSMPTNQLLEFLYKNKIPHTFYDIADEQGEKLADKLDVSTDETPFLACNEKVVKRPSLAGLAECLGISRDIDDRLYDTVVIGAGPSGLAAAIYAGSEGLDTVLLDSMGPGGQAGQSSKIENYMGFPAGLSGAELGNLGYLQAMKFGVTFTAPVIARDIESTDEGHLRIKLCTGQNVRTKTALIATGVSYRRLPIDDIERFEGAGVYYSATSVQARMCRDATVVVVGGGNSAGQAALYLSRHAERVLMLLRGDNLRKSMSDYLAKRIENSDRIDVRFHTEVESVGGEDQLAGVGLVNNQSDEREQIDCAGLFVFVGAKPHTEWLPDSVVLDDRGYVLTGPRIQKCDCWPLDRTPCELETTLPSVFAAGDVRSGTTKRCAFAAGDGAMSVSCMHEVLEDLS